MNKLLFFIAFFIFGCGASYHLRQMEYHERQAIAKGAKIEDRIKIENDTIYRDTVIYTDGETLDDTFNFTGREEDTIKLKSKEGVKAKLSINGKKKTGSIDVDCPRDTVKVKQKFYVNRRYYYTRKYKTGLSIWQYVGLGIFVFLAGFMTNDLVRAFSKPGNRGQGS